MLPSSIALLDRLAAQNAEEARVLRVLRSKAGHCPMAQHIVQRYSAPFLTGGFYGMGELLFSAVDPGRKKRLAAMAIIECRINRAVLKMKGRNWRAADAWWLDRVAALRKQARSLSQ